MQVYILILCLYSLNRAKVALKLVKKNTSTDIENRLNRAKVALK